MGILLAFAPFLTFAILESFLGIGHSLIAATIVSAAMLLRGYLNRTHSIKVLDVGTLILFGCLALYVSMVPTHWSVFTVRLRVDIGLTLILIASILIGKPFTLQYAREQVSPEIAARPEFLRANYLISSVWALAFVVMVAADFIMAGSPNLRWMGIVATVAALGGAAAFTRWYPKRKKH